MASFDKGRAVEVLKLAHRHFGTRSLSLVKVPEGFAIKRLTGRWRLVEVRPSVFEALENPEVLLTAPTLDELERLVRP